MEEKVLKIEPGTEIIDPEAYAEEEWTELVFPPEVVRIGAAAFMNCAALWRVQLPKGLKEIGEGAFTGCIALQEIVLPEGLERIGEMAFFGSGLRQIAIPESVQFVGEMAFWDCGELRCAEVRGMSTRLEKDAFGSCPKLAEGYFAPGFPERGNPAEQLQMILVWCTDPEQYDAETNHLAEAYFLRNEELIMEHILQENRESALRGLLSGAPEAVQDLLSKHKERYLVRCGEIGKRQGMQAMLLLHSPERKENGRISHFNEDIFDL